MKAITDYAKWLDVCKTFNWNGPYESRRAGMRFEQFMSSVNVLESLYNHEGGIGYIFDTDTERYLLQRVEHDRTHNVKVYMWRHYWRNVQGTIITRADARQLIDHKRYFWSDSTDALYWCGPLTELIHQVDVRESVWVSPKAFTHK